MNKIPIIVWGFRYNASSGGTMVLHKLCHMLREMGEEAYMWIAELNLGPGALSPAYNTPMANGKVDPKKCVVIYPEIVTDNPLKAKVVVRWILYTPGGFGPLVVPASNDFVFYYEQHFWPQGETLNHLRVFEPRLDKFNFTSDATIRSGGCFINRKGSKKPRIPETNNCLELYHTGIDYEISIFRSKEVFYSYDTTTVASLHAAICGCLSIIIPEDGLTADEFRKRVPLFRYGVAYGLSEDEINYAKRTQHLVKDYLRYIELEGYRHVEVLLHKLEKARNTL